MVTVDYGEEKERVAVALYAIEKEEKRVGLPASLHRWLFRGGERGRRGLKTTTTTTTTAAVASNT